MVEFIRANMLGYPIEGSSDCGDHIIVKFVLLSRKINLGKSVGLPFYGTQLMYLLNKTVLKNRIQNDTLQPFRLLGS